jgi:segregation and condensation protein A
VWIGRRNTAFDPEFFMDFRVDLDSFRGPLDLLLYLVRKHEVDITDIPIALVTEQYLKYLAILEELDVSAVGDFLAVASNLIEIKSQLVLPRGDEVEGAIDDPREELVRRLLEYKEFRDAASILDEQSRSWQQRFPRLGSDLPPRFRDLAEEPIREVELWDLVNAFGLIIRDTEASKPSNIVYDDTPIHVYMAKIHALVVDRGHVPLVDLFEPDMHKSTMISIFLAVLELVNHKHLLVEQNELFGEIWLLPQSDQSEPLDLSSVDNYDHMGQTA